MATHYEVLGVGPDATQDDIKRAYYRKARALHPDRHAGSAVNVVAEAQRAMADLNRAWNTLRLATTRSRYDVSLQEATDDALTRAAGRNRRDGVAPLARLAGSGFRYWMSSTGSVTSADGARRLNLAVDGARDLSPLTKLAPDRVWALHADGSLIGDDQLRHVSGIHGLRLLDLSATSVGDMGMLHLSTLDQLETLVLWGTGVGNDGLRAIGRISTLRHLGLGDTPVNDRGLVHLAGLRRLRVLQLWGTDVEGPGLAALGPLEALEVLTLPRRVGWRHRRQLKRLLPDCVVE